ncbi:hypothetical protein THASP1DRAFT_26871, partial [Thamnocephalis sphaerospora]
MVRATVLFMTLLTAAAAASPLAKSTPPVTPSIQASPLVTMSVSPAGEPFRDWSSPEVEAARQRLAKLHAARTSTRSLLPKNEEIKDGVANSDKVPQSVWSILSEAKDAFTREVQPATQNIGNDLSLALATGLVGPMDQALVAYRNALQGSKLLQPSTEIVSLNGGKDILPIVGNLPPEMRENILRLVEQLSKKSLKDILINALGIELATRLIRMVTPLATTAVGMLISDLRTVATFVTQSIVTGVDREIWLPQLKTM